MPSYAIYGLSIQSDSPIPPLVPGEPGECRILFTRMPYPNSNPPSEWCCHWPSDTGEDWLSLAKGSHGHYLRFADLGDFEITPAGDQITYYAARSPASDETVSHLLLDHVLPRLLSLGDCLVVHASSVCNGRGALLLMGESGRGKSTLAAALSLAGASIVTDDCLILRQDQGIHWAIPSYPGLRLWDDVIPQAFRGAGDWTRVADYSDKKRISEGSYPIHFQRTPVPICLGFVLAAEEEGSCDGIVEKRLSLRDALLSIVQHSYVMDPNDPVLLDRQLRLAENLVRRIPIATLRYRRALSQLPGLVSEVLGRLPGAPTVVSPSRSDEP